MSKFVLLQKIKKNLSYKKLLNLYYNENAKCINALVPGCNYLQLVAGLDWAYDLSPLHDDPVNAERIGYVTHPYAHKRTQPWEPKWEENFGFAADKYPVVATEFGLGGMPGQSNENEYGNSIIKYLEGKGISWVCWVFDPEWGPRLLQSWNYDLTEGGSFFKKALHGELEFQKKK